MFTIFFLMCEPIEEEVVAILSDYYSPERDEWRFLVKWWDGTSTWEPLHHLTNCDGALNDYWDSKEERHSSLE